MRGECKGKGKCVSVGCLMLEIVSFGKTALASTCYIARSLRFSHLTRLISSLLQVASNDFPDYLVTGDLKMKYLVNLIKPVMYKIKPFLELIPF